MHGLETHIDVVQKLDFRSSEVMLWHMNVHTESAAVGPVEMDDLRRTALCHLQPQGAWSYS